MKISITKGYSVVVDDGDIHLAMKHKWHARVALRKDGSVAKVYAQAAIPKIGGGQTKILLHRLLMGLNYGDRRYVDHRDNDGLNCKRSNLRIATGTQNQGNRQRKINSLSPYKGITWRKDRSKWAASIKTNGHNRLIGYFSDAKEAAKAYDEAALAHFGEFAHVNFPVEAA